MRVSITAGGHVPDLPFVIVNGHGMLIDLTGIGQLWDPTVKSITWAPSVKNGEMTEHGTIVLKNGTGRTFADPALMLPYLKAHKARKAELGV